MAKGKENEEQNFLNNPNDRFFKKLFGLVSVVRDYFKEVFPKHLSTKLDLNTLKLDTTSYITSELEEYYSDIVWQCQLEGKKSVVHICFIFEHKSYVPAYPHIQIGDYKQGAYNKQLAAEQPLSVVVPIILYHGKRPWIVKPFSSYFGDVDEGFQRFIDPCEYYLTNLQDYPDETIEAFTNIFLMKGFLAMKYHSDKNYIRRHYAILAFVGIDKNNSKEELDFSEYFHVYLYNISGGGITKKEIDTQIEQIEDNSKKKKMYNYFDELRKEGREIGIEKGIEKGIELGKKMSIYQVHLAGHDVESLSRIFVLPASEIVKILEEMKKLEQAKEKN
jgi:predicted transposase/invertase (TIGR01784 family)